MKFGKRLKQQIHETLPEWRDKFLSYKELKQLVRMISSSAPAGSQDDLYGKAEAEFVCLLNSEIDKFNIFFMEKEEDFIIRHKELQQRIQRVQETWGTNGSHPSGIAYIEEIGNIRKDIVNFHGEMVLLINYSNINYTGLAKILKKYDKRTGGLLRMPYIQKVVKQPFFTTELISRLIKDLEGTIDAVFPANNVVVNDELRGDASKRRRQQQDHQNYGVTVGEGIFRNTIAALLTMQEIRKGSSTCSHFSLPPLSLPDSDLIQSIQVSSPVIPILQ